MIKTVSFIGSGRVATVLAKSLFTTIEVIQICSKTLKNAQQLAQKVNADAITDIESLKAVDLILVCVPDDVIPNIMDQLSNSSSIVAHTSGATALDFSPKRTGFFYPLQSFQKEQEESLQQCPLFVGGKEPEDVETLLQLAQSVSQRAKAIEIEEKQSLHLAAVFVNNYVNHLFALTDEFLQQQQLDFTDLEPIISTTIQRAMSQSPKSVQTGPALRGDDLTLESHLQLLHSSPEMKKVYEFLAKSIQRYHED